ncbi:MAG TPA: hypothetical protein DC064_22945, partial [Cyanobacteria bacterium UBA9273]|nr:hypothetical protein [Cyanobacteria bacterium UBA9273]
SAVGGLLKVKREGIEPSLLTAFHPPLNCRGQPRTDELKVKAATLNPTEASYLLQQPEQNSKEIYLHVTTKSSTQSPDF